MRWRVTMSASQGLQRVSLNVNGVARILSIEPRVSLLDALRDHLGLTGTKKGCDQGACGACTVLVDGERINSCLALAIQCQDREIMTIEGLAASGELHPLQKSLHSARWLPMRILHAGTDMLRNRHAGGI